ncbi:MAG TPA: hypothetical protein VF609_06040 [Flavisolibacter sp.]|jgi:hypothetical protein
MRYIKLTAFIFLGVILLCAFSFFTNNNHYGTWTITSLRNDKEIPWARFYWGGADLNGKRYDRMYMFVPVKIEGLPYNFSLQFDLGDPYTELYEKNMQSVFIRHPRMQDQYRRLKGPLQFWNSNKSFKNLSVEAGDIRLFSENCVVKSGYGDMLSIRSADDTLHLGTLGADAFQNKVLIIDYPNQRFAICESLPEAYKTAFVDMEFGSDRKIIIPMSFRGKQFRVTFDNGSSMFPLITQARYIDRFSTGANVDTVRISSWGQYHNVTGRLMKDSFDLAGQRFANVLVYANHSGYGMDTKTDAMTGNALFWVKVVVIDFKNRKFGVK